MEQPLPRSLQPLVEEALGQDRVVLVSGARQSGKSTLLRLIRAARGGTSLILDDPALLEAARADPVGFVAGHAEPVFIDEVQRAGDPLVRAIKATVDADPRPGRFVLSGSTRFLTMPGISESLAGRMAVFELFPCSVAELSRRPIERFVDRLFEGRSEAPDLELGRAELLALVCRGGFPEVAQRSPGRGRTRWFSSYVQTVTSRDVLDVARLEQTADLPRLLRLVAARSAQVLNVADVSRDAGMPERTVARYLSALEAVHLVYRQPAWSRNLTAKVAATPKIHLVDSGLAAALLGATPESLARPAARALGPLLETFVVGELRKQIGWSDLQVSLYHYRDRGGAEVDLVLEAADGRVVALEVKAGLSVKHSDFGSLALLRDRLGANFVRGAILYAGPRVLPFGDRLVALPVSSVWA